MRLNDVVEVLKHVRQKGVPGLGDDDARIAPLLRLASTANLPAAAHPRPSQVVSALLREAIASEMITSRYSEPERTAMLIMFGATGTHEDRDRPGRREDRAAKTLGIHYATYRKAPARRQRINDVASAVLALVEERRQPLVDLPAKPEPFVPRPKPESRFRELLRSRSSVIAFAGPPSVGKRTLARQLTDEYRAPGSSVVRLIGSSQEALQQSIIAELLRLTEPDINYHVPMHSLRKLVLSQHNPRFVVIEDAEDTELAQFLTATRTDTTVVLTTTRRLPGADHIEVGELDVVESAALLSLVLPDITPDDATHLADDLGHHPLALLIAAALISEDQADVSKFRRGLRRTIAGLLDAAAYGFPSLVGVYRTAIDRLSSDARALLELLVYLDATPMPTAFAVQAIAEHRGLQDANVVHVRMLARSALHMLRDHYLIRVVDDQITVPALTRTLVIGSTHDRGAQTAARSRASVLALVRLLRADRPDVPLLTFVHMCSPLVTHVRATLMDPWKSGSLRDHLELYSQAVGHVVTAAGQPHWRLAVVALETSHAGFSIILFPIPEGSDDVQNLRLKVQLRIPELVEIPRDVHGWRDHKRIQMLLISQTLDVSDILADPQELDHANEAGTSTVHLR